MPEEIVCDKLMSFCYLLIFNSGDLKVFCIYAHSDLNECLWCGYLQEHCVSTENKHMLYDCVATWEDFTTLKGKSRKLCVLVISTVKKQKKGKICS